MITLVKANSDNSDFKQLVRKLDAEIAERDGADHSFYAQFNTIADIKYAIVAYEDQRPLGCGAINAFNDCTMEVKRMYVSPEYRGKGVATKVLLALENWAAEMRMTRCVLETGKRQPEAISLYKKNGYKLIPNYGQYAGIENSVCFVKEMKPLLS
jgi:GNAT superfamily N-acetyltransferase